MALVAEKTAEINSTIFIEAHPSYVHKYNRLFETAVRTGAPMAEIDLLCFVRDRLAARNGTGRLIAIMYREFRARMNYFKDVSHEEWAEYDHACNTAWKSLNWPHAIIETPPPLSLAM